MKLDKEGNNLLQKSECKVFLAELANYASSYRAKNYKEENFDSLFDKFDDTKNGFIEKCEICIFIKKAFRVPAKEKL